jgi:hypothetical protein
MKCPVCGAENEAEARFCDRCGNQLKPQSVPVTGPTVNLSSADAARSNPQPATSSPSYNQPRSVYDVPPSTFTPHQSGSAVIALILGIISFFGPYVLTAVPALIIGYNARRQIRASKGRLAGEGMAQAAIILGWISVGLSVIGFCMFCIIFFAPLGFYADF